VIGQLIVSAFTMSRAAHPALNQRWITASFRVGGLLPRSMMPVTIQRVGEIDALCRSLEVELLINPSPPSDMDARNNYLMLFSELWVSQAYSVCYVLWDRDLLVTEEFKTLYNDLRMLRVQIEKYELPSDNKMKSPMAFINFPQSEDEGRQSEYVYDPKDSRRAHIGRTGLSASRSVMWEVTDHKSQSSRWLDRRDVANRMLEMFMGLAQCER
jgi:hypothetical protein